MNRYYEFLASKRHLIDGTGFEPDWLPDGLSGFQKHIVTKCLSKGRLGVFADTGLGKTRIQVAIANNIIRRTNGRVLILTPLAVAFQFIDEANIIGIDDIEHTKDGHYSKKIIVTSSTVALEQLLENEPTASAYYQHRKDATNDSETIITTYESFHRLLNKIDASLFYLVIDEAHNFAASSSQAICRRR